MDHGNSGLLGGDVDQDVFDHIAQHRLVARNTGLVEQARGFIKWQTDDGAVAAVDTAHECACSALQPIGSSFVHRFCARHIVCDCCFGEASETHS